MRFLNDTFSDYGHMSRPQHPFNSVINRSSPQSFGGHDWVWIGSTNDRKLMVVPWRECTWPVKEASLRFKKLQHLNQAILTKFAWGLISSSTIFSFYPH